MEIYCRDIIAKEITKHFMKNRKRKGELTETELAIINSQINTALVFNI